MEKNLKYMSIEEIFGKIGICLSPLNIYYMLENEEDVAEYDEVCKEIAKKPDEVKNLIFKFLRERENRINKEILVLISLRNYINARNDKINKNINSNQYMDELKIEECKRMLDNTDVSLYGYSENKEKGTVNKIYEISSIALCAENDFDMGLFSKEQEKINKKRQNRLLKKQQEKEKKRNKNLDRLKQIEEKIDLKNALQFIVLDDFPDILLQNKKLAEVIKVKIAKNMEYIRLNEDKMIEPYTEEIKSTIKENIEHFDLDKLLLLAAYRVTEWLSLEKHDSTDLKNTKNILALIANRLNGKNTKISGTIKDFDTKELKNIKYDVKTLEKDLERFVDENTYLSDNMIADIKEKLLTGKKYLKDVNFDIINQLELTGEQSDKLIKISSENFIYYLDNCEVEEDNVHKIITEIEKISIECLYKLIDKKYINNNEIVDMCNKEKIYLSQLVELASVDIVQDSVIIDSFNLLEKEGKNELLNKDLLLQYFNIDKIKQYIGLEKMDINFLEFYTKILPEEQKYRNIILEDFEQLSLEITNKDVLISLYNYGLIKEDILLGKVTDDDILQMYDSGLINVNSVNKIYKAGIIGQDTMALVVDEEYKNCDIIQALNDGTIDLPIALQLYADEKVYNILKRYNQGILSSPIPAIFSFATSNMDIEEIDELYKKGIVKEEDLYNAIIGGGISTAKITEMYANMLISEEVIDKLLDKEIISKHDNELMKKALDMKKIVKNIDKSLGISFGSEDEIKVDEGIFLPEEKTGKHEYVWGIPGGEKQTKNIVIQPAIREKKFQTYGAKRIHRNNIEYNEKSPFNDYEFYIIPNDNGDITPECIVIAERYYEDKYSGEEKLVNNNATYIFSLKDLTRISKKSKSEILDEMKFANDSRIVRLLHSKHWSKNLDKKIFELLGKKVESYYTDQELKDIKNLSELIDGFKDIDGSYSRLFDIEI